MAGDRTERGPGDQVSARLADTVARLRRAMRRAARVHPPGNQLAVAQLELMAALAERPGARPSELARSLRLAPNTVTTLVNGLARGAMLTRTDDPSDRRMVRLDLTPAGRTALADWASVNEQILHRAQANLAGGQRDALRAALPALTQLIAEIDAVADHEGTERGGQRQDPSEPKVTDTDE